tara:strand:- start:204 stop:695 length:492 start_codon:yes stop_codon:yes gene_type:complete
MTHSSLTQERLKTLFSYNPTTGQFTRNVKIKNQPAGTLVGTLGTRGYLQCSVDGEVHKVHRLVWLYVHGVWPTGQIDHINHVTSDNRITNLRDVSCAQNHQNRARKTKSASGYLGVTWHKRDQRWQAHIEVNGKPTYLGMFQDIDDAVAARQQAEVLYHPHRP